jgi:hypothetical protein
MNTAELIQLQVLKLKASATLRGHAADSLLDDAEAAGKWKPVQMCAKVDPALYEALANVCETLSITKREFIESAVSDAVRIAEQQIGAMADEIRATKEVA